MEITLALLREAMEASGKKDFLIDGFPRSADNLSGWEGAMTDCADPGGDPNVAVPSGCIARSSGRVAATPRGATWIFRGRPNGTKIKGH